MLVDAAGGIGIGVGCGTGSEVLGTGRKLGSGWRECWGCCCGRLAGKGRGGLGCGRGLFGGVLILGGILILCGSLMCR